MCIFLVEARVHESFKTFPGRQHWLNSRRIASMTPLHRIVGILAQSPKMNVFQTTENDIVVCQGRNGILASSTCTTLISLSHSPVSCQLVPGVYRRNGGTQSSSTKQLFCNPIQVTKSTWKECYSNIKIEYNSNTFSTRNLVIFRLKLGDDISDLTDD